MEFLSPTHGKLENLLEVSKKISEKIKENPDSEWTIAIGTDSQKTKNKVRFCSAILLLEKGNGGTYFYSMYFLPQFASLQERMLKEAQKSISIGHELIEYTAENVLDYKVKLEIHCDLGKNGDSKNAIAETIKWIHSEFGGKVIARIKPDSAAASSIADKYTK